MGAIYTTLTMQTYTNLTVPCLPRTTQFNDRLIEPSEVEKIFLTICPKMKATLMERVQDYNRLNQRISYQLSNPSVPPIPSMRQSTYLQFSSLPISLSILTFNVSFNEHLFVSTTLRYRYICKIIDLVRPTVVVLQEVTDEWMSVASEMNDWYVASSRIGLRGGYWNVFMTNKNRALVAVSDFPKTKMGRRHMMAIIPIEQQQLTLGVSCVHLESGSNCAKVRYEQLQQVLNDGSQMDLHVVAGDFNTPGEENLKQLDEQESREIGRKVVVDEEVKLDRNKLQQLIKDNFIDLALVNPQGPHNTMLGSAKHKPWRPDRILVRRRGFATSLHSQEGSVALDHKEQLLMKDKFSIENVRVQRLGEFSVPPFEKDSFYDINKDGLVRMPSDHLGLVGYFTVTKM